MDCGELLSGRTRYRDLAQYNMRPDTVLKEQESVNTSFPILTTNNELEAEVLCLFAEKNFVFKGQVLSVGRVELEPIVTYIMIFVNTIGYCWGGGNPPGGGPLC